MATASTGILFNATAINKTSRVFRQITQSALAAGKKIATIGAGFAVGGAAAIAATVKSLGDLSDVAMRAGVSAEEITKMSTAMDMLGIKSSTPEQLAMAFQRMAKATGETGVAGFEKVIGAISEMSTVEERASAAMAVFGKSGMDFLPLIEAAAQNGTAALHDVIAAMPGVSDAAAQAGDDLADGMTVLISGISALWKNFVGEISAWIGGNFEGGIMQAALKGVAYIEFFAKAAGRLISKFFESWSKSSEGLLGGFKVAVENLMDLLGGLVKASITAMIDGVRAKIQPMVDAVMWAYLRITEGEDAAAEFWIEAEKQHQSALETMKEPFRDLANYAKTLSWFPDGTSVDLSDLQSALDNKLANAAKAAAAVASATVSMSAKQGADETAGQIERAVRATRTDFLTADTYRAATMSIRADYGKGEDKTVRAVNAVKSVNEKIQRATESTAAALSNLEMV